MNIIYCNGVITKLLPAKHLNQALGDKVIFYYDTIILYKLYKVKLVILFFLLHNIITNLTLK
jgi:hypothetical protein